MTADDEPAATTQIVNLGTWLRFLVGNRDAILQMVRCRQALWLGLAFVLSTGFAREYDGADLWHEPWHLVLPLVASLGTSLVLWTLVYATAIARGLREILFWSNYRTLLTFYWMTAPLAWLYAIPVERFLSPGDATAANFYFLGVVSVWRVLLITRATSVWLNAGFIATLFIVMFFADSVAVALAYFSPMPIFNIMGGIRLSEPDLVILNVMLAVQVFGAASWFVWLVGALIVISISTPSWSVAAEPMPQSRVAKPLWGLAAAFIALGFALLPIGQPEQKHAYEAARLLKANEFDAAVRLMAQYPRDEFPPIWDPPPRVGYGEEMPPIPDVLVAIESHDAPDWVRELYIDKLTQDPRRAFEDAVPRGDDRDLDAFRNLLTVYEQFVPADALDRQQWDDLLRITQDDRIGDALQKRLRTYLFTRKGR